MSEKIVMRVYKYIPDRLYGFCLDSETEEQVFFHLKSFVPGDSPNDTTCTNCREKCDWVSLPPPPILGEKVEVQVDMDSQENKDKAPRADKVVRIQPPIRVEGTVDSFDPIRGFGFAVGKDGISYHLHKSEIIDNRVPVINQKVVFYAGMRQGKPRACHVKVCR